MIEESEEESEEDFDRVAREVDHNLELSPSSFNDRPMRLSELDDMLSEVDSLHSSDNNSVASLDLNDFDPPGSPASRAPSTPLNLVPSHEVQIDGDLTFETPPRTPTGEGRGQ